MYKSRLSIFIFLAFLLAPLNWSFAGEDAAANLKWSFNGETFNLNPQFAKEDRDYYRNRPHPKTGDYSIYATDRVDDRYITDLAEQFRQWMNHMNLSDLERVNFVAAFTQSLAGVASDAIAAADANPRYPLETLIDKKGDCEDTAILAGTILQELDYEVALIKLGDHMGLGVVCNHCSGEYFYENGIEYLYLETAAQGWELGQIPPQYESPDFKVFSLVPQPAVEFSFDYKELRSLEAQKEYEIIVKVANNGSAPANNVKIIVSFTAQEEGQVYSEVVSDPVSLTPEDKLTSRTTLLVPKNVETKIRVAIAGENFSSQSMESEKLVIQ